jgi:hypothetical protein
MRSNHHVSSCYVRKLFEPQYITFAVSHSTVIFRIGLIWITEVVSGLSSLCVIVATVDGVGRRPR